MQFVDLEELWGESDWDYGHCPYYARYYGLAGSDPQAICSYGCQEEPACVTDEPSEGWPSRRVPKTWFRTA